MTTPPARARLATVLAAVLLTAGCVGGTPAGTADPTSPRRNADPPHLPATTPPPPVPTGRPIGSAGQFDADPCAVATAAELAAAIAGPYNLLAANTLTPTAPPSTVVGGELRAEAVGCGYSFASPNDASEAYHSVVVRITRWKSGGPALLAACRDAAKASPTRYRPVDLVDEACLGPNAILPLHAGGHYYTVTVTVKPTAARTPDEDVSIGALSLAAARVIATRLPRQ